MVSCLPLFFLICVVYGYEHQQCILFNSQCVDFCPKLMHIYRTRCDGLTWSQRTCDSPFMYYLGYTCGWARCDCNYDYVLDEQSHTCILLEDCPKVVRRIRDRFTERRKKEGQYRLSKRIIYKEEDENED